MFLLTSRENIIMSRKPFVLNISDTCMDTVGVSTLGGPWTDEWIVAACPSPDGSARDGARRGEGDRQKGETRGLRVVLRPGRVRLQ
jgi:hypothetical protein